MPFTVVELRPNGEVTVKDATGDPRIFRTGKEAAEAATNLSEALGTKFQPRPMKGDNKWRERELARFQNGTYKDLPWAAMYSWWGRDPNVKDHFAHVSTDNPTMVSFTESTAKGVSDIQSRMGVGAYLTKYYGHAYLSSNTIRDMVTDYSMQFENLELKIAVTPEEITEVYSEGPNSCMGKPSHHFKTHIHPASVYGAGDLGVAYLKIDDRITARTVIHLRKKKYVRIYGDNRRLMKVLVGYSKSEHGDFDGARLLRIKCGNGFVAPYLDIDARLKDDGTYLVIDSNYGTIGNNETGCTDPNFHGLNHCERCGERCDQEEIRYMEDSGADWCEDCVDRDGYMCDISGHYYTNRTPWRELTDGRIVSVHAFENDGGATCDRCDRNFMGDGAREFSDVEGESWCATCTTTAHICAETQELFREENTVTMANGDRWSREAFEGGGFTCAITGQNHPTTESVELEDGRLVHESTPSEAREPVNVE